ncbi:MAG: hypothetical protein K5660_07205 [Paludibacteraceae bacterium]|nr:hypothetical protein [Paludibacteraceae bacterium]
MKILAICEHSDKRGLFLKLGRQNQPDKVRVIVSLLNSSMDVDDIVSPAKTAEAKRQAATEVMRRLMMLRIMPFTIFSMNTDSVNHHNQSGGLARLTTHIATKQIHFSDLLCSLFWYFYKTALSLQRHSYKIIFNKTC